MAKTVSMNYTDTPISGVTTLKLTRGLVNFSKDWRIKTNEPKQVIATNLTSPLGKPENFRWGATQVADVYQNTPIEKSLQSPSKRGVQVVTQITDVWSIGDSADPEYGYDLPISGHFVLKLPADAAITEAHVLSFVGRLVSGLFDTGSETTSRLQSLLRGSLIPADLK